MFLLYGNTVKKAFYLSASVSLLTNGRKNKTEILTEVTVLFAYLFFLAFLFSSFHLVNLHASIHYYIYI